MSSQINSGSLRQRCAATSRGLVRIPTTPYRPPHRHPCPQRPPTASGRHQPRRRSPDTAPRLHHRNPLPITHHRTPSRFPSVHTHHRLHLQKHPTLPRPHIPPQRLRRPPHRLGRREASRITPLRSSRQTVLLCAWMPVRRCKLRSRSKQSAPVPLPHRSPRLARNPIINSNSNNSVLETRYRRCPNGQNVANSSPSLRPYLGRLCIRLESRSFAEEPKSTPLRASRSGCAIILVHYDLGSISAFASSPCVRSFIPRSTHCFIYTLHRLSQYTRLRHFYCLSSRCFCLHRSYGPSTPRTIYTRRPLHTSLCIFHCT